MIGYILLMICLFSGSVFAAAAFDRRAEETLPVSCASIIALLYIFYCFDLLSLGRALVLALCAGCYAYAAFSLWGKRKDKSALKSAAFGLIKNLATPGAAIFILSLIMVYFLTRFSYVTLFDELRLWGAYPKILYYTPALQTKAGALLSFPTMNQYPPGMPLFQYFVCKFWPAFSEKHVFFAYSILCLSLLMPATKHIEWKRGWMIIPAAAVFTLLPLLIYGNYALAGTFYANLYIDPALGFFLACMIYLAMNRPFSDTFSAVRFCAVLFAATLMKETGIILSVIACATAVVPELTIYRETKPDKNRIIRMSAAGASALLGSVSWGVMCGIYGLSRTMDFEKEPFGLRYLGKFLNELCQANLVEGTIFEETSLASVSCGGMFMLAAAVYVLLYFIAPPQKRKRFLIAAGGLALANFAMLTGVLILGTMNWGGTFHSLSRYVGTVLLADFLLAAMLIIRMIGKRPRPEALRNPWIRAAAAALACLIVVILPIRLLRTIPTPGWVYEGDEIYSDISQGVNIRNMLKSVNPPPPERVLLVFPDNRLEDDEYYCYGLAHRVYYDAIGGNFIPVTFSEACFPRNNLPGADGEELLRLADQTGCHFVYFYSLSGDLGQQLASLGQGSRGIAPQTLYRIVLDGNGGYALL